MQLLYSSAPVQTSTEQVQLQVIQVAGDSPSRPLVAEVQLVAPLPLQLFVGACISLLEAPPQGLHVAHSVSQVLRALIRNEALLSLEGCLVLGLDEVF